MIHEFFANFIKKRSARLSKALDCSRVIAFHDGKETSVEIRIDFDHVGNRHVLNVPAESIRMMRN